MALSWMGGGGNRCPASGAVVRGRTTTSDLRALMVRPGPRSWAGSSTTNDEFLDIPDWRPLLSRSCPLGERENQKVRGEVSCNRRITTNVGWKGSEYKLFRGVKRHTIPQTNAPSHSPQLPAEMLDAEPPAPTVSGVLAVPPPSRRDDQGHQLASAACLPERSDNDVGRPMKPPRSRP